MIKEKRHLFSCVYNEYLLFAKTNQKEQTFNTNSYNFKKHILPFFKDFYLEDITSKDILNWKNEIIKMNFKFNFNRNLYYCLSGFLEYCKKNYDFDKSIITNVGNFKRGYEKQNFDFYTIQEFNKFIKYVDDNIFKCFFSTLFYTGLRFGEATALRFSDLSNQILNITKSMNTHGNRNIGLPKNNSSIRQILIDSRLNKDLLNLKKFYIKKYGNNIDFLIFGGVKPISRTTADRFNKIASQKAGLRHITLHQFRHSHATLLVNKGLPITAVSNRLGHSKISTTLDIYSHVDKTQEKRVQNTLNSIHSSFQLRPLKVIRKLLIIILKL